MSVGMVSEVMLQGNGRENGLEMGYIIDLAGSSRTLCDDERGGALKKVAACLE